MKIVLAGKNDAAVSALEFLVDQGNEMLVLGGRNDKGEDGWQRSLKKAAERLGVAFEQPERVNADASVQRLVDYRPDLFVSIQYDQILRGNLFRAIGCPCINLHYSLLPRHRGVAPIAWAILSGDSHAGVTLHEMVEEIDAGDILAQRKVEIGSEDTARDLYEKLTAAGDSLFTSSYPFSADSFTERRVQDTGDACYHKGGDLDFSKRQVAWDRSAAEVHRFIRAFAFPPFQYPESSCNGRTLWLAGLAGAIVPLDGTGDAVPGTVISATGGHLDVAAADGALRITRMLDAAQPDLSVHEVLGSFEAGDRFA